LIKLLHIKKNLFDALYLIVFWSVSFLFTVFFYGRHNGDYLNTLIFTICLMPVAFLSTWFINEVLIPKYLLTRRFFRFIVGLLYTFIFSLWVETMIVLALLALVWNYSTRGIDPSNFESRFLITGLYFIVFAGVAIRQFQRVLNEQRLKEEQQGLKTKIDLKLKESELNLLKAQINPHFLFNSLNCVYGLSLEKSDNTPEVIMHLSNILDYTLYGCNTNFVSLNKELELTTNYAAIQKYRYGNAVNFNMEQNTQKIDGIMISPLLLLPLVENAFKYCTRISDKVSTINVKINADEDFSFAIENPYSEVSNITNGGIGLENLKKRLELIYPDRHSLIIEKKNNLFKVQLTISKIWQQ